MSTDSATLSTKLQAVLDGDYAAARDEARALLTQPAFLPADPDLSTEEFRALTTARLGLFTESGIPRQSFAAAYGGTDNPGAFINAIEMMAHADLSLMVKQGVNFGLFGLCVNALGSEEQKQDILPRLIDGRLKGGFAMTEEGHGSNVQEVRTEAVYDHASRSFIINTPVEEARKIYIGNAARDGEVMVVFAQLKMSEDAPSNGVHVFLVPIRDEEGNTKEGVKIEDCGVKVGLKGVDNGAISFDHVAVPYENMLPAFAAIKEDGSYDSSVTSNNARFFKTIATLVMGRIAVAASSLSINKSALATALAYADTREVFGTSLLDKQATHARLFPRLADAYAMHFATRHLMQSQNDGADVETLAAALKARASDDAYATVDECRQVAGGSGFIASTNYGRWRDDVDIFRTFEGDNVVLRMLAAKNAGKANMQSLAEAFNERAAEGYVAPPPREGNPLDPAYQQEMFALREYEVQVDLAQKMAKIFADGGTPQEKMPQIEQQCQTAMLAVADAYAERVMMEQFIKAVEAQEDPEVRAALQDMCNLFAVNTMQKNAAWYLEHGIMAPDQTRQLAQHVDELQRDHIRPNALAYVDAFGIPQELLAGPQTEKTAAKPHPMSAPAALTRHKAFVARP